MNWDGSPDLSTLPCVKWTARGRLLYGIGSSARCSAMTWRNGVVGQRHKNEGLHVCMELIHFIVQQKLTNTVKQFYSYKNK